MQSICLIQYRSMKHANYLLLIFAILILVTGLTRYKDYVIARNYVVYTNVPCDTELNNCFQFDCSNLDGDCDESPFTKIEIEASKAPRCLFENDCKTFFCTDESMCTKLECNDDTVEDGELCVS
jgi:hypothetical protein